MSNTLEKVGGELFLYILRVGKNLGECIWWCTGPGFVLRIDHSGVGDPMRYQSLLETNSPGTRSNRGQPQAVQMPNPWTYLPGPWLCVNSLDSSLS